MSFIVHMCVSNTYIHTLLLFSLLSVGVVYVKTWSVRFFLWLGVNFTLLLRQCVVFLCFSSWLCSINYVKTYKYIITITKVKSEQAPSKIVGKIGTQEHTKTHIDLHFPTFTYKIIQNHTKTYESYKNRHVGRQTTCAHLHTHRAPSVSYTHLTLPPNREV